jgi:hypothetical protein
LPGLADARDALQRHAKFTPLQVFCPNLLGAGPAPCSLPLARNGGRAGISGQIEAKPELGPMKDNPFRAWLLMTGVLSAWAVLVFFAARFLLGLVADLVYLKDFEVALLAVVVAVAGALAGASLVVINEHGRGIVRAKRRI